MDPIIRWKRMKYGTDKRDLKRYLGFLLVCFCATMGQKKSPTEARLSINDQTEPQRPQHLQLLLIQLDL